MKHASKADKQLVVDYLHLYVRKTNNLTIRQYERLFNWLNGMTYAEIADKDGVSRQAVGLSIHRDFTKILRFAQFMKEQKK